MRTLIGVDDRFRSFASWSVNAARPSTSAAPRNRTQMQAYRDAPIETVEWKACDLDTEVEIDKGLLPLHGRCATNEAGSANPFPIRCSHPCGWRIRNYAAIGIWNRPRQWCRQA